VGAVALLEGLAVSRIIHDFMVAERLLTPREVADKFRVDPRTVTRWADAGRIWSVRTPGGHARFRESEILALLAGDTT
jgi:excisionase family DNA binding protein